MNVSCGSVSVQNRGWKGEEEEEEEEERERERRGEPVTSAT